MADFPHIDKKQCRKCGQIFPSTPEFFQRNRAMCDGLLNHCKTCCSTAKPKEIIPEGHKRCSKCKEIKPATNEFFHFHDKSRDELYSQCIQCKQKEWREKHPGMRIDEGCKYCSKCHNVKPIECFYQGGGRTQSWCKECHSNYRKNRETVLPGSFKCCIQCQKEYPATPEFFHRANAFLGGITSRCKACQNAFTTLKRRPRQADINRRLREWYAANREEATAQARIRCNKRRAQKRGNKGTHAKQDIQAQYKRQKGTCYYCHEKLTRYHVDHVVPLSRGGSNGPDNLVVTCPTCNLRKHDKLPHEWPEGNHLL